MPNTSATGGFLLPATTPAPLEDAELDAFLQEIVVGLTGINGSLVRPRWQPAPPNLPAADIDWMAIGVVRQDPDTFAAIVHVSDGDGVDQMQRHETLEILVSSYGPNNKKIMSQFRDGLQIAQNREVLQRNGWGLLQTGEIRAVPELIKDTWLRRSDMLWAVRRAIWRDYPVLNLLSMQGTIDNGSETVSINTPAGS